MTRNQRRKRRKNDSLELILHVRSKKALYCCAISDHHNGAHIDGGWMQKDLLLQNPPLSPMKTDCKHHLYYKDSIFRGPVERIERCRMQLIKRLSLSVGEVAIFYRYFGLTWLGYICRVKRVIKMTEKDSPSGEDAISLTDSGDAFTFSE
ncbi:hypothetical protein FH972_006988 [Carpinus fangiana]|uniref:Uncharacterized protein n=1 Tax=Carpinus fangiana TaxID=176857 RepID=A0A5N6QWX2_9ROSI|nr:hypothetical protein FH972_006988 [Carpinus fangiana]